MFETRNRNSMAVCLLLWCLWESPTVSAQANCTLNSFRPIERSWAEIGNDYKDAVFAIKSGPKSGTAYVIDSENGYAITSAHVVVPTIEDDAVPIKAVSPPFSNDPTLSIVEHDLAENADFALLRFDDRTVVEDIEALDVSMRLPAIGEEFFSYSWGQEPNEDEPLRGDPKFVRYSSDGTMRFSEQSTGVVPGDSGSPLIDTYGMVIGTLKERKSRTHTNYVSNRFAAAALTEHLSSAQARALSEGVLDGTLSDQSLLDKLDPTKAGSLRNLHLFAWARDITIRAREFRNFSNLFSCPILPAYTGRGLDQIIHRFFDIYGATVADRARFHLAEAQLDKLVANNAAADKNFETANSLMLAAIADFSQRNETATDLINCRIETGGDAACNRTQGSNVLAAMYQDLSLTRLYWALLAGDDALKSDRLSGATDAGQLAILATNDFRAQGLSYTVVGDVFQAMGDPEKAASAYATAYSEGFRPGWVVTNFLHYSNDIEDGVVASRFLDGGIQEAPVISVRDIVEKYTVEVEEQE